MLLDAAGNLRWPAAHWNWMWRRVNQADKKGGSFSRQSDANEWEESGRVGGDHDGRPLAFLILFCELPDEQNGSNNGRYLTR